MGEQIDDVSNLVNDVRQKANGGRLWSQIPVGGGDRSSSLFVCFFFYLFIVLGTWVLNFLSLFLSFSCAFCQNFGSTLAEGVTKKMIDLFARESVTNNEVHLPLFIYLFYFCFLNCRVFRFVSRFRQLLLEIRFVLGFFSFSFLNSFQMLLLLDLIWVKLSFKSVPLLKN